MLAAVERHRAFLATSDLAARRRGQRAEQVVRVVSERLHEVLWGARGYEAQVRDYLDSGVAPYDVADRVLDSILEAIPEAAGGSGRRDATCS